MANNIRKSKTYGRGKNGFIFFFMVFWCLAIGGGVFYMTKRFAFGSEGSGFTVFRIIWLSFASIIALVFFLIGVHKVKGAGLARKIRRNGAPGGGRITNMSNRTVFYSDTPVNTKKITFQYRDEYGETCQTTQLVGGRVFHSAKYYENSLVPIRILNGLAVLDNKAICRGERVSDKNTGNSRIFSPSEEIFESKDEKLFESHTVQELTNEEDKNYVRALASAVYVNDKEEINKLGFDKFESLKNKYENDDINYLKGALLLQKANSRAEVQDALNYFAKAPYDYHTLCEAGLVYQNGCRGLMDVRLKPALQLFTFSFAFKETYFVAKRIYKLISENPGIIDDETEYANSYAFITCLASDKKDKDVYYYLAKNFDRFIKAYSKIDKMKFDKYAIFRWERILLYMAQKYGYDLNEKEKELADLSRDFSNLEKIEEECCKLLIGVKKAFIDACQKAFLTGEHQSVFKKRIEKLIANGEVVA